LLTVLTPDGTLTVDGTVEGDSVLVDPGVLDDVLGWHLDDRGLCRGDVCVPARPEHLLRRGDLVDLVAAAPLVGRQTLLDAERAVLAVSVDAEHRRSALADGVMPEMTFADLDGHDRRFSEFGRRKKLLVAFASW
jgi:hypothetical protein